MTEEMKMGEDQRITELECTCAAMRTQIVMLRQQNRELANEVKIRDASISDLQNENVRLRDLLADIGRELGELEVDWRDGPTTLGEIVGDAIGEAR